MKFSAYYDQVLAAYIAAKAEIAVLPLIKDAQGDRAKYLKLNTLLAAIEPILLANQLVIMQGCAEQMVEADAFSAIGVLTRVVHSSTQWIENFMPIPVVGAQISKKEGGGSHPVNAQSGGVSISYGRRYGLLALFSLMPDEDSDGAIKSAGRRKRALGIAEEVASKTDQRLAELRQRLNDQRVTKEEDAAKLAAEAEAKNAAPKSTLIIPETYGNRR